MTRIDVRPGSRRLAKIFKNLRSRVVYLSNPRPRRYRRVRRDKKAPPHRAIVAAFNYLNQNSDLEYQLLRPRCVTPVLLYNCILLHVDFVAKKAHVDDAPEEMFFAELRLAHGTHVYSPRLCISLGPIDSISGDRMNGCCYCRGYNSVCHPKGGGFVRGHDGNYKTVQDIYDTDMLKQVPPAREPTKESDYSLQHVDNASQYATEVVKFVNQTKDKNYEVVKPGFATRVILTEDCSLFHVNFKAKENDPNAPVKLFFAEFTTTNEVFSFKCCVELGQKAIDLGDLTGDKTNGCYYCHDFNKVCHPTYGGFVRGGDSLYKPESELRCSVERTSWTKKNAGRRFLGCLYASNGCNFFRWVDPPSCSHCCSIIPGLLRRNRENEEKLKVLEAEKKRIKKWFVVFVVVVSIWIMVG